MNLKLTGTGAGIFSQFMTIIPNAIAYPDIENIYINTTYQRFFGIPLEGFNAVFDQYYDDTFKEVICTYFGTYTNDNSVGLGKIEDHVHYQKLKSICSKLVLKESLKNTVNDTASLFRGKTLGVHIRLGDMNAGHPEYGVFSIENYIARMKKIVARENIDTIFIASDNDDSISKILDDEFQHIIYHHGFTRNTTDDFKDGNIFCSNVDRPEFWREAFAECLSLSRCDQLLCRVSNLANAAIIFSNTIEKIHRL
jgi:hypothetical protein